MKLISKLLILIPFGYLLYNLIKIKEYFDPFYFYGFYGLSVLGILGILLDINYNLSIFYLLISFVVYSFFYDLNVYNLWAVGGLILLIKYEVNKKDKVEKEVVSSQKVEEKLVPKEVVASQKSSQKVSESKVEKTVPKEVKKVYKRSEKVKEDIWEKYRDKDKFNKFKNKLIKLIVDPYGIK